MLRSLFACSGSWLTLAAMSIALTPVLGCGQNDSECVLNAQRCEMVGLKVDPTVVELNDSNSPINQAFKITKNTPWPWLNNGLDVCLIDKGSAAGCTRKEKCDLTVPANRATRPSDSEYSSIWPMSLFSQVPAEKTYCLEMRFAETPLPEETPVFAELRVVPKKPPVLGWKDATSNPLTFIPSQTLAANPNLTVRGLWLGRGGSDLASTELLLLQGFTNSTFSQQAAIRRSTASNPTVSWVENPGMAGLLFSVWRFGATEVQNPRAVLWNETTPKQYSVIYGALQNPEPVPELRGTVTGVVVSAMAIAMQPGSATFGALVQTDLGIKSFVSTGPSSIVEKPVKNVPAMMSLSRMAGYADKVDGSGTVGVLGFTTAGEPALFSWNGTEFSYDLRSEDIRRMGQVGTAVTDALAVGDVDGNGYNDIVVARAGKVKFFLQRAGSFAPSATEVTPPMGVNIAALAVGQLDAAGKLDLAIADATSRKCASLDCNHVYVYLNQTP